MVASSVQVTDVSELKAGDHIKWKRLPGYDHHAIVERVDGDKVHVIEYGRRESRDGKGRIRQTIIQGVTAMYKYIYDRCDDAVKVLQRATKSLNEKAYNLVTNNCEHFATYCKTGYKQCSQIQAAVWRIANGVAEGVSGACGTVAGRCVAKYAVAAAKRSSRIITRLSCRPFKNAVASGGKAIMKNPLKSARLKAGVIGVSSFLFEVVLFGYNCCKAYRNYENAVKSVGETQKERLKQERNEEIIEAGCEALGAIGGVALGAAIDSFIPVPIVGTAVGAPVA